jgi:hypothetical protein
MILNKIAGLFERDKSVISRHLSNIYKTGELDRGATVAFFATVLNEGGKGPMQLFARNVASKPEPCSLPVKSNAPFWIYIVREKPFHRN